MKRDINKEAAAAATDEEELPSKGIRRLFDKFKNIKSGLSQVSDVMDFVNDFKKNKYHVKRRLNLIFLALSLIFAVLSGLNFVFSGTLDRVGAAWDITVYALLGLYALTLVGIGVAEMLYRRNVTVQTTKAYNKALTVFLRIVRTISLIMSAVTFAVTLIVGDLTGKALAMNIIVRVFSVIMFIISLSSSISKIFVKFIVWLKSPVNKRQFRFVATEWYCKVSSDSKSNKAVKSVKKVKESRIEGAQRAIDEYLLKSLGKKYMDKIKASDIAAAVEQAPPYDRDDVEGTVKNIFEYAQEMKIIVDNPCDELAFSGDLGKKPRKPVEENGATDLLKKFFGKK